jgi:hypothetical protein
VRAKLRLLALATASGVAVILPAAGALTAAGAATATPAHLTASATPASLTNGPGRAGKEITLANNWDFFGYDAATDASGTSYIGWIASSTSVADRTVYLCTLPRGATSCAGGIRQTPSLGISSAAGLRVVATPGGKVTLVWMHDDTASENGPEGSEITTATRQSDGSLSAPTDVAPAPSFGDMLTARLGPNNSIWVITQPGSGNSIQVTAGLSPAAKYRTVKTPYPAGTAELAFSGSTAVAAIQKEAFITHTVAFATDRNGSWSGFHAVAHTWTAAANLGLVHTDSGIRLLASVADADYWPVVSRWTGSTFTHPHLTGDRNNCAPDSHDPVSDASGRMADVSQECEVVAVTNLPDTLHAAVVRFPSGGTFSDGRPQITTTPRGRGWVIWSIESSVSNKLIAVPVLLPDRLRTVSASSHGDQVHLTGPASCLTPVSLRAKVTGSPATHWRVESRKLLLDGSSHSATINGGKLRAGTTYTLSGRVVFGDGGARRTVTAKLKFKTCPNP